MVESTLSFNILTRYGNITVKNKARHTRIVNPANKSISRDQRQLCRLYSVVLKRKATQIFGEPDHPLNSAFEMLPSGRRIKVPVAKKNMHKKSFIPPAVVVVNGSFKLLDSSNVSAI